MTIDETPPERPDFSTVLVGDNDEALNQEVGTGKAVFRRGAEEAQADIDIGSQSSPHDLIGDGDFTSGNRNTGGAEALAGFITSDDDRNFTITVTWNDSDNQSIISDSPDPLTQTSEVKFNLIVRSDRFDVTVTDESGAGQNNIRGSVNAH